MASYEDETASDRERRRERRRERHKRRAERHAKRASASPDKNNITVTPHPLNDDPVLESVHLSSMEQRDPESRFRTAHDQKEFHQTIDPYPPPKMDRPDPVEMTDAHLNRYNAEDLPDLQQYSYDHGHDRGSSAHHQRKERHDRHGHEKRKQHHESRNRQYYDEKHRSYHSETLYRSPTDDFKTAGNYAGYEDHKSRKWSWNKKLLIIVAPIILLIIIILAVAIAVSKKHSFKYTPSFVQVTNSSAFTDGGASKDANNTDDGIGAGTDRYIYYSGPASQFPSKDQWVSFADMWAANRNVMLQACKILDYGKNDSDEEIDDIHDAIQSRASASLVDHRLILAVILQESHGCVRIPTTNNGVKNPGLMQSANGASFSSYHPSDSILQMVQDGTQGTKSGPGLAQHLNTYGNAYSAARMYNSGAIAASGDLSNGNGATACYVSDIANRLTGWIYAKSTCPSATS